MSPQMDVDFGWKQDDRIDRHLINIVNISLCEVFKGRRQSPVYNWIMSMTGKSLRRQIHECPWVVSIKVSHISNSLAEAKL